MSVRCCDDVYLIVVINIILFGVGVCEYCHVDISLFWFPNEWNCLHFVCTIRCCDDANVIAVVYIFHFCCSCVRFFIINWQFLMELMSLDLCHVGFKCTVFIAPLYWGVNDVLSSLSDLFDFIFWCIFLIF